MTEKENIAIITSLPIIAFACAFIYEAGYLGYFGFPITFSYITAEKIALALVSAGAIIIYVGFISSIIIDVVAVFFSKSISGLLVYVLASISALFILAFFILKPVSFLIISLILLIFFIILGKLGYIIGRKSYNKTDNYKNLPVLPNLHINLRFVLITLLFAFSYASMAGYLSARYQYEFLGEKLSNDKFMLIINKADTNYLMAEYNLKEKKFSKRFMIKQAPLNLVSIKLQKTPAVLENVLR